MNACVARQPILDRDREVYAYELLFRSGPENVFCGTDGDEASVRLMNDTLHLHGLSALTEGKRCFLNITRNILVNETYSALPPENTVLELLETIEPDEEVVNACREARERGYQVALDDYVLDPKFECILPHIDVLKVDFLGMSAEQREQAYDRGRAHGLEVLAEKVENYEDFDLGRRLGYQYFQGFFFCKPEMISNRDLPANKLTYLRFLQQLNQPELDLNELEQSIAQDVSLSYRLLRYLNSPIFGFRSEITSIRHGLALLGERPVRKWASLVAVSKVADDKPTELLNTCMTRAKFCEAMAECAGMRDQASSLFMLGMFSLIDAMLDRPMPDLVNDLALNKDVRGALTGEPNDLHNVLLLAVALERGEWRQVGQSVDELGVSDGDVSEAYRESIRWSAELLREFGGESAKPVEQRRAG